MTNILSYVIAGVMLIFLSKTITMYYLQRLNRVELFFWGVLWLVIGVVAMLPFTASVIASYVGVGRGADLPIYVSIIVLFYLSFRIYNRVEELEHEITEMVREKAIDDADDD